MSGENINNDRDFDNFDGQRSELQSTLWKYLPVINEMSMKVAGTALEKKLQMIYDLIIEPKTTLSMEKIQNLEKMIKNFIDIKGKELRSNLITSEGNMTKNNEDRNEKLFKEGETKDAKNPEETSRDDSRNEAYHHNKICRLDHSYAHIDEDQLMESSLEYHECYHVFPMDIDAELELKTDSTETLASSLNSTQPRTDSSKDLTEIIAGSVSTKELTIDSSKFEVKNDEQIMASTNNVKNASNSSELEASKDFSSPLKKNGLLGVLAKAIALEIKDIPSGQECTIGSSVETTSQHLPHHRKESVDRSMEQHVTEAERGSDILPILTETDYSQKEMNRETKRYVSSDEEEEGFRGWDRSEMIREQTLNAHYQCLQKLNQDVSAHFPTAIRGYPWIFESISNIAFAKTRRGFIYKCLISGCKFQTLVKLKMKVHLEKKHIEVPWSKHCKACSKKVSIKATDGLTVLQEYKHLDTHTSQSEFKKMALRESTSNEALPHERSQEVPVKPAFKKILYCNSTASEEKSTEVKVTQKTPTTNFTGFSPQLLPSAINATSLKSNLTKRIKRKKIPTESNTKKSKKVRAKASKKDKKSRFQST